MNGLTEGDIVYVVIRVQLGEGRREVKSVVGVSDDQYRADGFLKKATDSIPDGEEYPRYEIEEVIVI